MQNVNRNSYYVYNDSTFPTQEHYLILEYSSVFIPGDERSRTNPGHGYPEHSEDVVQYHVFFDKEEWEWEIQRRVLNNTKNFSAAIVQPVKIKTSVSIST